MELVVDVIGELETSIKTAANAGQAITNCANCANCSQCRPLATAAAAVVSSTAVPKTPMSAGNPPGVVPGTSQQNELLDYKNIMAAIKEETERKSPQHSSTSHARGFCPQQSVYVEDYNKALIVVVSRLLFVSTLENLGTSTQMLMKLG